MAPLSAAGTMKPDDFKPAGHWRQATRGPTRDDRRPIWRIEHPEDPAFYAEITLDPPSWRWRVEGRIGLHNYGYEPRKRKAMRQAINALQAAYESCQPALDKRRSSTEDHQGQYP